MTTLSDNTAISLSKHKGGYLSLNGLSTISDSVAEILATHKSNGLYLNGLTSISDYALNSHRSNKTGNINTFIIEERRKSNNPEVEKMFFGPNGKEFFGYTRGLIKQYPHLDEGTIHMLSKGKVLHHKGWVIDKSLLSKMKQNDKGNWRIKK